ncbi:TraV family lipoprotein [Sphingomonas sp. MMS12-HWE2-04]|uniref:TraV family lipoprotein n=1 Tax=Sphingomonas sp. MMS12-HWE2-04 TaxID=3234199 RepID=UPI00384D00CE
MAHPAVRHSIMASGSALLLLALPGCATLGAAMSPYSEKFSCKNSDHGQCIHPEKAYADAVAGVASGSEPRVTKDKALLADTNRPGRGQERASLEASTPYADYRSSLYRELKGLIEAPATPMLKPARTVRTLILPYADRQRPDRLYMPRFVYSIVDKPVWVVGGVPSAAASSSSKAPVLGQVKDGSPDNSDGPAPEPRK